MTPKEKIPKALREELRELDRLVKRSIIVGVSIIGAPMIVFACIIVALRLAYPR